MSAPKDDFRVYACIDLLAPFVYLKNTSGVTLLMATKHLTVAAPLILRGVDIYATTTRNSTPLLTHIILTDPEMVKFLLSQDVSMQTPEARQSLFRLAQEALQYRRDQIFRTLMTANQFDNALKIIDKAKQIASITSRPISEAEHKPAGRWLRSILIRIQGIFYNEK